MQELPIELAKEINSYLPPKDLANIQLVNRFWFFASEIGVIKNRLSSFQPTERNIDKKLQDSFLQDVHRLVLNSYNGTYAFLQEMYSKSTLTQKDLASKALKTYYGLAGHFAYDFFKQLEQSQNRPGLLSIHKKFEILTLLYALNQLTENHQESVLKTLAAYFENKVTFEHNTLCFFKTALPIHIDTLKKELIRYQETSPLKTRQTCEAAEEKAKELVESLHLQPQLSSSVQFCTLL